MSDDIPNIDEIPLQQYQEIGQRHTMQLNTKQNDIANTIIEIVFSGRYI